MSNIKYQMSGVSERGITLYLAIVTMSGALAIALFVSSVFIKEFRISQDIVNSIKAVYVADTVMEYSLYQARQTPSLLTLDMTNCSNLAPVASLSSTAKCSVISSTVNTYAIDSSLNSICALSSNCIQITASGAYAGVNRRIEIVYPNL